MSCNGCRVLRKGCSDTCALRPCLEWIEGPEAQAHATLFVAKFFGRAGLMSFLSAAPEPHRPALFRSLLFEACGRTINPVNGAVGLLWTGGWDLCQAAVETVLQGGALHPLPPALAGSGDEMGELYRRPKAGRWSSTPFSSAAKRRRASADEERSPECDLDLCLMPGSPAAGREAGRRQRPATPSMDTEASVMTSADSGGNRKGPTLLRLFV